jgi:hypothetical protein
MFLLLYYHICLSLIKTVHYVYIIICLTMSNFLIYSVLLLLLLIFNQFKIPTPLLHVHTT